MEIGKSLPLFLSLARQRSLGRLLEEQIDNFEFKLLMINAGHIKDHLHGSGARGGKQDMAKTRGSSAPRYVWSWMRMVYLCLECIRNCPAHALSLNPPHVCRLGSRTCRYAECDPVKCTHMVRGLSTEVWPGQCSIRMSMYRLKRRRAGWDITTISGTGATPASASANMPRRPTVRRFADVAWRSALPVMMQ